MQEAIQQRPQDSEFWSLLSKATSDLTYLDEIKGPHREKLTDNDKRAFNTQAMEHAHKVSKLMPLSNCCLLCAECWRGSSSGTAMTVLCSDASLSTRPADGNF